MKNLLSILPTELTQILNSEWFEDNGGISIDKLENLENEKTIQFSLDTGDSKTANQLWQLNAKSVKSTKIDLDWSTDFYIFDDHFLLWEFTDYTTGLYFNGDGSNGDKLFVDFHKLHKSLFGKYFDIDKYLNDSLDLNSLCNSNVGIFAHGPMKILEHYYNCLKKNGRKPYYQSYDDPESKEKLLLLIIGKSYIIAEKFFFTKLE